jgi:flagellar hook-associated protein 1 FlgK
VTYDDRNRATVVFAGITAVTPGGGQVPITRADIDTAFTNGNLTAGRLQALEDAYVNLLDESVATSYPGRLNTLAQALATAINTQHALGIDLDGNAGAAFFDVPGSAPPGAAARIRVSPAILADARTVAAGAAGSGPGSNQNALDILALRQSTTTGGTTFEDFYSGIVTGSGAAAEDAKRQVDATGIVVATLEARRSETSGVSLDEEMTNMLRFQHAYSAAARVLTAMDENISKLMSMGRVGA